VVDFLRLHQKGLEFRPPMPPRNPDSAEESGRSALNGLVRLSWGVALLMGLMNLEKRRNPLREWMATNDQGLAQSHFFTHRLKPGYPQRIYHS
jgi:hypothetical protein